MKKFKIDIDRLADFWKEWLDIGQHLVSFSEIGRILDRYVERLVEFGKDWLDFEEFWIDIESLKEFWIDIECDWKISGEIDEILNGFW